MGANQLQRAVFGFVLQRAFRKGIVKRSDILSAFKGEISQTRASELLSATPGKYPKLVERQGYAVVPRLGATAPEIASENQLMEAIFSGNDSFAEIGLTESELPRQRVEWTNNHPIKPGIFHTIVAAITAGSSLDIEYVSLKTDDVGRRRTLYPIGIQRVSDQWRLVAYDLNKKPPPQRVFVLSRILEAAFSVAKVPASIRGFSFNAATLVKAPLNPSMTEAQRKVVEHELSITGGVRRMPASEEFEFLRRYGDVCVSPTAVWPIIMRDSIDE